MQTFHVLVKGKVQGVFFRVTAKEVAEELGITGWIKNTDKGDVEIMISGDEEGINKFLSWCKNGPRRAVVTDVEITEKEYNYFEKFSVIRG